MKRTALQAKWKKQATAKKQKTYVKTKSMASKLAKPELKAFDTAIAFTVDQTGEVPATGQLSLVTTGDTLADRDGAVIQVKSLQIRGTLTFAPAAAALAACNVYIYIVQDRQANGAAAAIASVLTGNDMSIALGNVPNQYRFKILKRLVFTMQSQAGATTAYNNVKAAFDEYIKFYTPIEMRYTASAGAITDVASNNLFLLAGSDAGQDDTVTVAGTARLRFTG